MARALIIVDVQNDFCEGGAMAVDGGNAVAERLADLLDTDHGYDVVAATADWHIRPDGHFAADGEEPDFADTWPVHCVADTPGAQLHPALGDAIARNSVAKSHAGRHIPVFRKGAYTASFTGFDGKASTFPAAGWQDEEAGGTVRHLRQWLDVHDVDQIDVVGLAYDFCVKATALDAATAGYQTRVLTGLTAAVAAPTGDGLTTADHAYAELTAAGVGIVAPEDA